MSKIRLNNALIPILGSSLFLLSGSPLCAVPSEPTSRAYMDSQNRYLIANLSVPMHLFYNDETLIGLFPHELGIACTPRFQYKMNQNALKILASQIIASNCSHLDLGCLNLSHDQFIELARLLSESNITSLTYRMPIYNVDEMGLVIEGLGYLKVSRLDLSRCFYSAHHELYCKFNQNPYLTYESDILKHLIDNLPYLALTHLDLSSNNLIGICDVSNSMLTLPHLQTLKSLSLADNHLRTDALYSIGEALKTSSLEELDLSHAFAIWYDERAKVDFDTRDYPYQTGGILAFKDGLLESKVRKLHFGSNGLDKIGMTAICEVIEKLDCLEELSLNGHSRIFPDHQSIEEMNILANAIKSSKLKKLSLNTKGLDNEQIIILAEILPQTQIEELSLFDNKIHHEGVQKLIEYLTQMPSLKRVNLDRNYINSEDSKKIARELAENGILLADVTERDWKWDDIGP